MERENYELFNRVCSRNVLYRPAPDLFALGGGYGYNEMSNEVAIKRELPEPVARRGIGEAQWRTLTNNLYPGADVNSVLMVWDYCAARKLDPMKKPCHIVPMFVKDAKTGRGAMKDVILPGIYEVRTTAMRTGLYMGHSKPEYGPIAEHLGVKAPEWCQMTMYRWNDAAKQQTAFQVMVYFSEVVATVKDKDTQEEKVNARWTKAPTQMLIKCTEAAGLREAFPDELGGVHTEEEMAGQEMIDITPPKKSDIGHIKDEAWDALTDDKRSQLIDLSIVMTEYLDMGDALSAEREMFDARLSIEEQMALWTRFD